MLRTLKKICVFEKSCERIWEQWSDKERDGGQEREFDKHSIFNLFISIGFAFLDELSKVLWLQQTKHHTLELTAGDNSHCTVFDEGKWFCKKSLFFILLLICCIEWTCFLSGTIRKGKNMASLLEMMKKRWRANHLKHILYPIQLNFFL